MDKTHVNEQPWGIHWFRRDLRFDDNPALSLNLERNHGRTVGLFCFDSKFLSRDDFSHRRFAFFIETIKSLRQDLELRGGQLLVVDGQPDEIFTEIVRQASVFGPPKLVTFNRDYEPFARERDKRVTALLQGLNVNVVTERDHMIFEPHEITKPSQDKSPYQKYSPYLKRWLARFHEAEGRRRVSPFAGATRRGAKDKKMFKLAWEDVFESIPEKLSDRLEAFQTQNIKKFQGDLPPAGFAAAREQVAQFATVLKDYARDRAIPARRGSAELSKYFKNGSLTLAHVIQDLKLADVEATDSTGPGKFLKELIWREFYYYTLYHFPKVEQGAFIEKYRELKWEGGDELFRKWQRGETGVPIVDAGMRELAATGWINNRVRIIVATHLIKDLLVDWRRGERHFMNELIDGDLAPNNGNWQWVASTGGDSQPFFRVMNPWVQGKNFDPDAEYIKRWVPELKGAAAKLLHEEEADRSRFNYPAPLNKHSVQKTKAIDLYRV